MTIGSGKFKYKWIENWVKIPDTKSGKENGRTHGVVVSESGNIFIFNQADPAVLEFNPDGKLVNSWGDRFSGAHGMSLIKENDKEYLWLTDEFSGEVVKTTLFGKAILNIKKPDLEIYSSGKYSPTWAAVNEERFGGNGDIWVTDGYGMSYVHHYDRKGNYINSLSGEEGAGRFNCPHAVAFHYLNGKPELFIADRGNKRFQVYDAEGKFLRSFGDDIFGCPCESVTFNDLLYIPELCARLAVMDKNEKLITYLGQNETVCDLPGWPNHKKELIEEGKFNSPHSLAVDKQGNIYVVEWIVGGRITKLEKIA